MKRTLVIGASTNPERYSFKAANLLLKHGHEVELYGIKNGEILGNKFITDLTVLPKNEIDTVTLYVGPQNQEQWTDFILKVNPKRIIFNPGTENVDLWNIASKAGIFCEEACTLVLLNSNQY
ncbi:MAG: hypothetical protein RLZZ175_1796 [Bacteroidota bacterium]|jgi:predicted CoA-binding protein